jgi:hypothetical protein
MLRPVKVADPVGPSSLQPAEVLVVAPVRPAKVLGPAAAGIQRSQRRRWRTRTVAEKEDSSGGLVEIEADAARYSGSRQGRRDQWSS